jgi:adenylate cyclase
VATGLAVAVLVSGTVLALWPHVGARFSNDPSRVASPAAGTPSIVVLPFHSAGASAEHDSFAEGLTNDLITDLSKVSGLLVIGRHSAFSFRGTRVDVSEISKQLGVRYVLTGSIRRTENAVRINVQLTDAATKQEVWAERYDRDYAKIFALQDELIGRIVDVLSVKLTDTEKTQITRLPTNNLEAYDYYTRAEQKAYKVEFRSLGDALTLYEKAIQLDPNFADAYAGYARAVVDVLGFDFQRLMLSAVARRRAYEAAGRALQLDPNLPRAYAVLGNLQILDGEADEAIASLRKAVALDPNGVDTEFDLAIVLTYAGLNAEALEAMQRVLHLDPKPRPQVYDYYAFVLYMNRQYDAALEALEKAQSRELSDLGLETQAMAFARLGRLAEAKRAVETLLTRSPSINLANFRVIYAHHHRKEDLEHRLDALRDAGVPEWSYGFRASPEDRLNAAYIKQMVLDKTWTGRDRTGATFHIELTAGGDFAQRAQGGSIIVGKYTLEGDSLCMQSDATLLGRKFCSPVYRTPGGSAAKQNEYVFLDSHNIWSFSVSE